MPEQLDYFHKHCTTEDITRRITEGLDLRPGEATQACNALKDIPLSSYCLDDVTRMGDAMVPHQCDTEWGTAALAPEDKGEYERIRTKLRETQVFEDFKC